MPPMRFSCLRWGIPQLSKKRLQYGTAFGVAHAADGFRFVVRGRVGEDARAVLDGPGFRGHRRRRSICRCERRRLAPAHIAQGSRVTVRGAIGEEFALQQAGGVAQYQHFGVGAGILHGFHLVAAGGDDAAGGIDDRSTHRHLAAGGGGAGFAQRDVHSGNRGFAHGSILALARSQGLGADMTKRPLIGLTLDAEQPGGYSKYPWYALRQNYISALTAAGGLAVALPHEAALAAEYLDRLDALIVTGGAFDVDPALYGDEERHATVELKVDRTSAELALLRGALARNMPVLGICGGEQLLAVALGGSLIQHIPDSIADALAHEQLDLALRAWPCG